MNEVVKYIKLKDIVVGGFQERLFLEEDIQELRELSASISSNEVIDPIIVRPHKEEEGKYELIAGERRVRACKISMKDEILAVIRDYTDEQAVMVAFVENTKRKGLRPVPQAKTLYNIFLLKYFDKLEGSSTDRKCTNVQNVNGREVEIDPLSGLLKYLDSIHNKINRKTAFTPEEEKINDICNRAGVTARSAHETLTMLKLNNDLLTRADESRVSKKNIVEAARLEDPEHQKKVLDKVIKDEINTKDTKKIVNNIKKIEKTVEDDGLKKRIVSKIIDDNVEDDFVETISKVSKPLQEKMLLTKKVKPELIEEINNTIDEDKHIAVADRIITEKIPKDQAKTYIKDVEKERVENPHDLKSTREYRISLKIFTKVEKDVQKVNELLGNSIDYLVKNTDGMNEDHAKEITEMIKRTKALSDRLRLCI